MSRPSPEPGHDHPPHRLPDHVALFCGRPLPAEVHASLLRLAGEPDVVRVAVMPDVHLAGDVCVGTVVATRSRLLPLAVGGDAGCGMATVRMQASADLLADPARAARLLLGLQRFVPINRHPPATAPERLPPDLAETTLSTPRLERCKRRDARVQFATLGAGNHFLEVQADDAEGLWLCVHTGSRGIGEAIRAQALGQADVDAGALASLDAGGAAGRAYVSDVDWARRYAAASRRAILDTALALCEALFGVGADPNSWRECDHNHVQLEVHDGVPFWVHRKGALSARSGEPGIIPGSMGAPTFHVRGRGHAAALTSSSHGAGRALPRGAARRAIGRRQLEREMRGIHYAAELVDALRGEAPSAYHDIAEVMRAQRDLTRIERRLRPVLVHKGA